MAWAGVLLGAVLAYTLWSPGQARGDGAHDLGRNGVWLQHGWIGDDVWFATYHKEHRKPEFRDPERVAALARQLAEHHVTDLFPHLAPCDPSGGLLSPDHDQLARFLDAFPDARVMPWIGGVFHRDVRADLPAWRARFIADSVALLERHPRLAGVHLNIEPWPSGDPHLLTLLDELRAALPEGKILSLAGSPPPVPLIGNHTVHWTTDYIRQVSDRVDHVAFMNYDSGLELEKLYVALMSRWTRQILEATPGTEVLIGLPVYDDAGVPWHDPEVEHLDSSLRGLHGALSSYDTLPPNYRGVALYSDWEMEPHEWALFSERFLAR
jgi:hypothetical protein